MADVKKQMEPSSSIRPEVITENQAIGLEVVDGHAVKAPADYQSKNISSVRRCVHDRESI